ncbi:hypothetical protein [Sporisorium scitamineum]|uniref:Uncharacterized protein n=1 Tax=Sporisorium scitamineum TaxID=49012 RepID=A0A0F7S0Y0_9BASI|nr:hypothetical protein [Sporisorium scitamineum]
MSDCTRNACPSAAQATGGNSTRSSNDNTSGNATDAFVKPDQNNITPIITGRHVWAARHATSGPPSTPIPPLVPYEDLPFPNEVPLVFNGTGLQRHLIGSILPKTTMVVEVTVFNHLLKFTISGCNKSPFLTILNRKTLIGSPFWSALPQKDLKAVWIQQMCMPFLGSSRSTAKTASCPTFDWIGAPPAQIVFLQEMQLAAPSSLPHLNPLLRLHPFANRGHQAVLGSDTGILIRNTTWEIEESSLSEYFTYARVHIPDSEPALGTNVRVLHLWSIHAPPIDADRTAFWNADVPVTVAVSYLWDNLPMQAWLTPFAPFTLLASRTPDTTSSEAK